MQQPLSSKQKAAYAAKVATKTISGSMSVEPVLISALGPDAEGFASILPVGGGWVSLVVCDDDGAAVAGVTLSAFDAANLALALTVAGATQ